MARKLWEPTPERAQNTNMSRFIDFVNQRHSTKFDDYPDLYEWSVENIPDLWASLWDFLEVRASSPYEQVIDDLDKMPGADWFPGARMNFAENLLRYRDDRTALIFKGEGRPLARTTYRELYEEVARVAAALKAVGLKPGDRVAGFTANVPQAVVAMLASVSLGATWTSSSPDFGEKGVLDRFGQTAPKVLFATDGYLFKGREFDSLERVAKIVDKLPTIEKVVVVPYAREKPDLDGLPQAVLFDDFKAGGPVPELEFVQLPFGHPLYIMYSSGTTGLPKCMVQSAGGVLMNQMKELVLHTDLGRDDTIFYFTTCGWMMWNWLVASLAVGAGLVLFDGNPFHPDPGALWQLAEEAGITVFGTSAGYLAALEAAEAKPGRDYELGELKSVLSTGSPLSIESFEYVYREIKEDLQLASISGGSDLNGCFALGNPMAPVYAGELQSRGLGMKVFAYDDHGQPVVDRTGELVCAAPFPSMPVYFWADPDGAKYHAAYFDVYPGIWRHGDFIEINHRGGVTVYGRSDATLNPGGVRIGTAEIYRQVEAFSEIEDSVVIGQDWRKDVRVVLFVKMKEGNELTEELVGKIRKAIRANASPRHVPAKIVPVPDIPYTLNMKKVELAVKKMVENRPVLNRDALRNPECLDYFSDLPQLRSD